MKKFFAALFAVLLIAVRVSASSAEYDILRIDIKDKPEKFEYLQGEALDLSDLYITVTYENGNAEDMKVTEDMISGYDPEKLGVQLLTVTYLYKSTSFSVKVVKEHDSGDDQTEAINIDTSIENRPDEPGEGKPNTVIIIAAVAVAAAAAAVCITAIIKKPKKEDKK